VLLGAEPLVGVVAEKSGVQLAGEVAVVQVLRRLARELILAAGDEPFLGGKEAPGDVPVVRLARLATVGDGRWRDPEWLVCGGSDVAHRG